MRALVLSGPGDASVADVDDPAPGAGEVVVAVARVGICGTDSELFSGALDSTYPIIPGHEWSGTVVAVGPGVDERRIGERVAGDTFIGCGRCAACDLGRTPACADRLEIGVRGHDGAAAEFVGVPGRNALQIPAGLDFAAAALIEPASNAVRAVEEIRLPAERVLIRGAGTLGLIAARLLEHRGASATIVDPDPAAVARARRLGATAMETPPADTVDAIIDLAPTDEFSDILSLLRAGGTLVVTGFPAAAAAVRVRDLVDRDLRVIGTLGAVGHLGAAARLIADGTLRVDDLVGSPIGLDDVPALLAAGARGGLPKTQIDPSRRIPERIS